MVLTRLLPLLALATLFVGSANAQPIDSHTVVLDIYLMVPGCETEETGREYLLCVDVALTRVDRELNEVYQRALAATDKEAGLRAAQRAWVAYRDADCESGLSEAALGAAKWRTGHVRACEYEKTRLRVAELRSRFLPD